MSQNALKLGDRLPAFSLPDVTSGNVIAAHDLPGSALLVAFICNHCPFVLHLVGQFSALAEEYTARGVSTVAISSNDIAAFPEDGPAEMRDFAAQHRFSFPYLYDESQEIARAFGAVCTPEFYVFDAARTLVYHGQFDGSRPTTDRRAGNDLLVTGADVRSALDAILAGNAVDKEQRSSIGCSIKWKEQAAAG